MADPKTPAVTIPASLLWLAASCAVLLPTMVTAPMNGLFASSTRFPFLAGLIDSTMKINYIPFCTGTILTATYVLTTCGCIKRNSRTGGTYNRHEQLQAPAVVVIYGTAFSPTFTVHTDRLYPNWELDPEISKRHPSERTEKSLYDARRGKRFILPETSDLEEIFMRDRNKDEIVEKGNEYIEVNKFGQKYAKYWIDFAVIELEREIIWDDEAVPAIFPLQSAGLTRQWWEKRVTDEKDGVQFMESCYLVGWGGWNKVEGTQVRLRYTEVKFVPYNNCEMSYCTECSYCNNTIRVKSLHQACYKSVLNGDACSEDEGAPVWCPWAGITTTRNGKLFRTGAVLGLLSRSVSCLTKNVPSIYSNTWQAYGLISRAVGYSFPPNILVYEDVFEQPS